MDLRHLNYFLVLAEELHFGRAAERLCISQPPLSRMIQQIEEDFGVMLFERNKKSVKLTQAGLDLLSDSKLIMRQMDAIKTKAKNHTVLNTGVLKIAYAGAVMHSKMISLLKQFSIELPNIELAYEELTNHEILYNLHEGNLDIAFVRNHLQTDGLENQVIEEVPIVAIVAENHPLAKYETLDVERFQNEKFIAFKRDCGPTLYDYSLSICARAGFNPNIVHNATQLNSIVRLVENGFGIAFLPADILEGYGLKLKAISLKNCNEKIPLIALYREQNPNPVLKEWIKFSKKEKFELLHKK
ncbi:MAG: LysR family transcriptional regulator [Leadbetterella sp.]